MTFARLLALLLALFVSTNLPAHEVRPAFLQIRQTAETTFETTWRVPALGDLRLSLYLEMPASCTPERDSLAWSDGTSFIEEGRFHCPSGLVGEEIRIAGLENTLTDALARYERADGTTQVVRLTPAENRFIVTESENWREVVTTYFVLGVEHILMGIDHLLFVLALLILVPNLRTLFWTVTAFTLAHSVTLAGATLGWVEMPGPPVEAIIALSIVFIAMEIMHYRQGRPGITRQWPWLVAFIFGLLHGFGFAGALSEIGLPEHAIPLALLFFNLGVEAGQLLFIAAVLLAWSLLKQFAWPRWVEAVPVYIIGSVAAFWTIERLAGFVAI